MGQTCPGTGCTSAVSSGLEIDGAHRIDAAVGGQRLSDHDGYVVDLRMETVD
jgi:hypothetical protein